MPTALRAGPYRVYFHSGDRSEPPHVHVSRDDCSAKFWIDPVVFVENRGFSPRELHRVERLVLTHATTLRRAWREFFSDG